MPGPEPFVQPFRVRCPAGCGTEHMMIAKPSPAPGGAWPKVWCHECQKHLRLGRAVCVQCLLSVS
eukprot:5647599-Alexandrium_andersonii.AAC.1